MKITGKNPKVFIPAFPNLQKDLFTTVIYKKEKKETKEEKLKTFKKNVF